MVVKTTLSGEVLLRIGAPDRADLYDAERRYVPTDVCVAPNGDIYVSDGYGQYYVHQYDAAAPTSAAGAAEGRSRGG